MLEVVTLPLHCPRCGGAVTAQFTEWTNDGPQSEQRWTCPYCQREHQFLAPGKIAWVTKRNAEEGEGEGRHRQH